MNDCVNVDDAVLLERLSTGDKAAYTEIYNRYWQKLFAVAANKLNNLADAEEIVQDIFLELWNRRVSLVITSKLSSYLSVSVSYKVINVLAKRNVQNRYQQYAISSSPLADYSTIQWLEFEELRERFLNQVAQLPEKCQLVFKLSREENLSYKEIAKQLSISEKTVEAHLSKARHILKMNLTSTIITATLSLKMFLEQLP
ncbi:MAG: RNA polymerase sigma-70 factor [Flavobacterium sp.]|nr:RNA polymerase sigma-70 factor [Flavobacterium sp.]